MNQVALIVGNDKVGRKMASLVHSKYPEVPIILDNSSSLTRVLNLLKKRALSPLLLVKMALAELLRPQSIRQPTYLSIASNKELLALIEPAGIKTLLLFRAGLIINKKVIATGTRLLNVHCGKIPEYGGLGSISRALADGALQQEATMHIVTRRIDEGEIVAVEPYLLSNTISYGANEELAYDAGIRLIFRQLPKLLSTNPA